MRWWILAVGLLVVVGCENKPESDEAAEAPEPASTTEDELAAADPCPTFDDCKLECPDGGEMSRDSTSKAFQDADARTEQTQKRKPLDRC